MSQLLEYLPRLPSKEERNQSSKNPFALIGMLTPLQHAFFFSGWLAWVVDAIDFFAVSLSSARLAVVFAKPTATISLAITLTLLFRPLGAAIFGLASDRYGRRWPLVINLLVICAFSLATGFTKSFPQFLGCRAMFGIAMGGIWGLAASLSLENMPIECRGLFSGLLQLGYPVGYLIIAAINLNPTVAKAANWRYLFWIGAGFSFAAAVIRAVLPESQYFLDRKAELEESGQRISSGQKSKIFFSEMGKALKKHWLRCIFGIIFMSAFNFYSHGSQDLYPSYIQLDKGLTAHQSTLTTIIGNCGAITGCACGGYISQYLGRRLTIICFCLLACACLPLWLLPTTFGPLAAGAFLVQAGVQGAYGVVPVYLAEISPQAFRATWPGLAYQLGNMVSAASAQIEATAGAKIKAANGRPNYGKVSAILIGVAAAVIIVCCLFGAESHGVHFEQGRAAFERDGGLDAIDEPTPHHPEIMMEDGKNEIEEVERIEHKQ